MLYFLVVTGALFEKLILIFSTSSLYIKGSTTKLWVGPLLALIGFGFRIFDGLLCILPALLCLYIY